ncbi:hypothetical protein ESCAB7627_2603 [Escherichia albertii TW07627]|uniref:Uncharacterized protein n=1 Tax=Escherichia albertii (strain TW07627) TaxID=502347 RepID=A0ABC9NNP5_ESCAT|nr:hypothetical protein EAKF1_ch4472 [Escherichia albertii KF1]EDS91827.1 hypothetical protein ESCAB7627_2603 [Escherichia albertii TW07627]
MSLAGGVHKDIKSIRYVDFNELKHLNFTPLSIIHGANMRLFL